jgi:hypothetical protein
MQSNKVMEANVTRESVLKIRFEEIGWALFLPMIGALWLFPDERIPPQAWLVGAGLIMLGINFTRYFSGIKMSGFTVFLGIVALVAGGWRDVQYYAADFSGFVYYPRREHFD